MADKYLQFTSEVEALTASHAALVYAGKFYNTCVTHYLWPVREGADGFFYMVITDHPNFKKYETMALPNKLQNKLISVEPVWAVKEKI